MNKSVIENLLSVPPHGKIAVVGDFCVDVYWDIEPSAGEVSLETGIMTTPVTSARYSLGGAGNIVANLRGMVLQNIPCAGAAGNEPFGIWMRNELLADSVRYETVFQKIKRREYHTPVYCKPLLNAEEQSRLDLGNTPLTDDESANIIAELNKLLPNLKTVIINGQLSNGIHSDFFRREFAKLVKQYENEIHFVFDGRDYLTAYPGVTLKINADAASRLAFGKTGVHPEKSGSAILEQTGKELVVTDGENGAYVFEKSGISFIPAIRWAGPVDTVGAGDSFTAGFSWGLACGASLTDAARLGTCCSAVTVRKINQTGVPYPEEIFDLFN
jgi:sugar/nucleoside kinase (ribokinase family)